MLRTSSSNSDVTAIRRNRFQALDDSVAELAFQPVHVKEQAVHLDRVQRQEPQPQSIIVRSSHLAGGNQRSLRVNVQRKNQVRFFAYMEELSPDAGSGKANVDNIHADLSLRVPNGSSKTG